MSEKFVFLVMLLLVVTSTVLAQTTGGIAGVIVDDEGNRLGYVNVFLPQTDPTIGTQSRENGTYILTNIPVGTYDIVFQLMGYAQLTITGQRVNVNETARLNVTLTREAIAIEGETVTGARHELVIPTQTGTRRTVDMDSIADIALDGIEDVIALQAGVVSVGGELHIRGGRAEEVVYTIDGMSVSDPVDGRAQMTIDMDAVKDMSVMTGGFTAEFGNAQSGIVNIVTRDGTGVYSGKVEFISDHLILDGNNRDEIKINLGGPVLGPAFPQLRNRLTFFFNAALFWSDTRFRDLYNSNPNDDLVGLVANYPTLDYYEDRDSFLGFDLNERNDNRYNANIKLTWRVNPTQTFSLSARGDYQKYYPYSHGWRYALDNFAEVKDQMSQYMVTYDHVFNPQMNIKMRGSIFRKEVEQGPRGITRDDFYNINPYYEFDQNTYLINLHRDGIIYLDADEDGIIDHGYIEPRYWAYRVTGQARERSIIGFQPPGRYWTSFIDDKTTTISFRSDFEYQINLINNFKTGIELINHQIVKDQLRNPQRENLLRLQNYLSGLGEDAVIDEIFVYIGEGDEQTIVDTITVYDINARYEAIKETSGLRDGYKANHWQGAYYIQNRMEFEGMIANVGLRFDFWYLGDKYQIRQPDGSYRYVKWEELTDKSVDKLKVMVSPRVGVSHPISDRAVLHFAYNYQNQIPQMQYIFTTARPIDAVLSNENIDVGNPNLEPQITITYEVGLQRQLSEDYVFDIQAYFKNIYNYVSLREQRDPEDDSIVWYEYVSEDYGTARGIDFTLQRILSNFIAGSLSYSIAWADGNNAGIVREDENKNIREFPLDWDQRHTVGFNFEFRVRRDEEWYVPFTDFLFPMDDFSLNFVYNLASGKPYTPMNKEGTQMLDTNSRRMPYTASANLRFTKNFNLGGNRSIRTFISVNNLFNRKNVVAVYPRTGRTDWDGEDLSEIDSDFVYSEVMHNYTEFLRNPSLRGEGRRLTVGVSYNW